MFVRGVAFDIDELVKLGISSLHLAIELPTFALAILVGFPPQKKLWLAIDARSRISSIVRDWEPWDLRAVIGFAAMRISILSVLSVCLLACSASPTPGPPSASAPPQASETGTATAAAPSSSAVAVAAPASASATTPSAAPVSAFSGTLLGKPFAARSACVVGIATPGRVSVEIYDAEDFDVAGSCLILPQVIGARSLSVRLLWKTGAKADFAAFSFDDKQGAESKVTEFLGNGKYDHKWVNRDFHPKGTVEVLRAVVGAGQLGRIRLSLDNGGEKLAGEIDVYSTSDAY